MPERGARKPRGATQRRDVLRAFASSGRDAEGFDPARGRQIRDWLSEQDNAEWIWSFLERRAARVHAAPQEALVEDCLAWMHESRDVGLAIVSSNRRLAWTNELARGLVETGRWLQERRRRLRCALEADEARFGEAIGQVLRRGADRPLTVSLRLEGRGDPLLLTLLAMATAHARRPTLPFAVLRLQEADAAPIIDESALRQWFGLTEAEAALASAFAAGCTLADYAQARGVAMSTVRTQFARIKERLGARDQAAVVRRVLLARTAPGA